MKGLWLYVSKAVSAVLALGIHAYVARQSPSDYGILPLALQWIAFLTFIADFGLTTVAPREWMLAPNAKKYEDGVNSLRFGVAWVLAATVVIAGLWMQWPLGLQIAPVLVLWPFGVDWMLKTKGWFGALALRQVFAAVLQCLLIGVIFESLGSEYGPGWLPLALSLGLGLSFVIFRPGGLSPESSVGFALPGLKSAADSASTDTVRRLFRRQSIPFFSFALMHLAYGLGTFVLGFSLESHPEASLILAQHGALFALLASGSALVVISQEVGLSVAGIQARNTWTLWASFAFVGLMALAPLILPLWLGKDFTVSTPLWAGFVAVSVLFCVRYLWIHQSYFDTHYRVVVWANGFGLLAQAALWTWAFLPSTGHWLNYYPVVFLCLGEIVALAVYWWRK